VIKERVLDAVVGFGVAAVFLLLGRFTHVHAWSGAGYGVLGATVAVVLIGNGELSKIVMGVSLLFKKRV
jgi:hypothetical protein